MRLTQPNELGLMLTDSWQGWAMLSLSTRLVLLIQGLVSWPVLAFHVILRSKQMSVILPWTCGGGGGGGVECVGVLALVVFA